MESVATMYIQKEEAMALPQNICESYAQHNILGLIFQISRVVESSTDENVLQGSQTNITYFACEF